ncbi:YesL family protein [Halalkalibacter urbisdiaboli]|uniref:YesL family protein n=1 Tax=Halalkalibacter urbisdiaboli TaxID=1960589 RepID=UPI0013FE0594|nr:YesL family protein [Halalkalibacter urbisdiaboli]
MEIGGFAGIAYSFCRWFVRLAYLNVLWIVFTFAGLMVFGLFPSTVALFTVTRKWVMGEKDIPIAKTFWKTYKFEFIKANKLAVILGIMGIIFFYNLSFLKSMTGMLSQLLYFGMLSFFLMYFIVLLYIFPVYVHYDTKVTQALKNAFVIGVSNPFYTVLMITCSVLIYILLFLVDLFIFFNISTIGLLIMWCTYRTFEKIDAYKVEKESKGAGEVSIT